MSRSALLRSLLLSCVAALVPTAAHAYAPHTLDDRSSSLPSQLAVSLPIEAAPSIVEAHPFGTIPRLSLGPLSLDGRRFKAERGFQIVQYANDNPTRFVDPTGHSAWDKLADDLDKQRRQDEASRDELLKVATGYTFGTGCTFSYGPCGALQHGGASPEEQERIRKELNSLGGHFQEGVKAAEKDRGAMIGVASVVAAVAMGSAGQPPVAEGVVQESSTGAPRFNLLKPRAGTASAETIAAIDAARAARAADVAMEESVIGRGQTIFQDQSGTYITGSQGEALYAGGKWSPQAAPRNAAAQANLAGKLEGDQSGHLLPSRGGFQGDSSNLSPMAGRTVNQGTIKRLENFLANQVKAGRDVMQETIPVYGNNPLRPDKYVVTYSIDNSPPVILTYDNPAPPTTTSAAQRVH